jgi:hypothetical protein
MADRRHGWSKHLRLNLAERSNALSGDTRPVRVPVERTEQRTRLRDEQTPVAATLLFAVLDMSLDDLLRRRFTSFRTIYVPAAGQLGGVPLRVATFMAHDHFPSACRHDDCFPPYPEMSVLLRPPIPSPPPTPSPTTSGQS